MQNVEFMIAKQTLTSVLSIKLWDTYKSYFQAEVTVCNSKDWAIQGTEAFSLLCHEDTQAAQEEAQRARN